MNLAQLLTENIENFGEYASLVFERREYTNIEREVMANRLGHGLKSLGVKPGDRVMIVLPNLPQALTAFQAVFKIGAVVVPVTYKLTADEVTFIADDAEAEAALVSEETLPKIKDARTIRYRIMVDAETPDTIYYPELVSDKPKELETLEMGEDDLAMLMYTAGTTGRPKGVMLSHGNLMNNTLTYHFTAERSCAAVGIRPREMTNLTALPLSHGAGVMLMNRNIIEGSLHVVMRWWDTLKAFENIEKYRVRRMGLVPAMARLMLKHPRAHQFDTSSVLIWSIGGAVVEEELIQQVEEKFGGHALRGYGLTECSPGVIGQEVNDRRPGSVGRVHGGLRDENPYVSEIRIVDDDGKEVPRGVKGEVIIRGESVTKGYWKRPEETGKALRGGWLYTGDLGYIDQEGYLFLVDRKKDLIIRGGENIVPAEVEDVLRQHPCVEEAGVIGVPDQVMGEAVKGFVTLKKGCSVSESELIEFTKTKLAPFKVPQEIAFVEDIPKSGVGKIMRRALRELNRSKSGG
jgi:long-chain acyl-CoA synthetase